MRVDVTRVLHDVDGSALKDGAMDLIMRTVLVKALQATYPDERGVSYKEKVRRYNLASEIFGKDVVELDESAVRLIQRLVGDAWAVPIVGEIDKYLKEDGNDISS